MDFRITLAIALISLAACAPDRTHTLTCWIDGRVTFERTAASFWRFNSGAWRTLDGDLYRPSFYESCYTHQAARK